MAARNCLVRPRTRTRRWGLSQPEQRPRERPSRQKGWTGPSVLKRACLLHRERRCGHSAGHLLMKFYRNPQLRPDRHLNDPARRAHSLRRSGRHLPAIPADRWVLGTSPGMTDYCDRGCFGSPRYGHHVRETGGWMVSGPDSIAGARAAVTSTRSSALRRSANLSASSLRPTRPWTCRSGHARWGSRWRSCPRGRWPRSHRRSCT